MLHCLLMYRTGEFTTPSESLVNVDTTGEVQNFYFVVSTLHLRITVLANIISEVLYGKEMFENYFHHFKIIVIKSRDVEYVSLNNIIRMIHSIIIKYTSYFQIPKQVNNNHLPVRVNNIMTYAERQDLQYWYFTNHK